eukprot:5220357-Alexandrium_andersonii.AAC.1
MSASLVGSEMCIRDSSLTTRDIQSGSESSRGSKDVLFGAFPPPGRFSSPVSYTHLTLPTICSV